MIIVVFMMILFTAPGEPMAPDAATAVPVQSGYVVQVNGYLLNREALARLLTAPEKERQLCEVEKNHIISINKIELDKQIEKVVAEYETRLRVAALSATPKVSQAKSAKWYILGAFTTGVVVGIISFFTIQAAK